ncbi:MAG TPA: chitobiase/beta-hexosaminidase C-terminal domain-containing protein, partial [Flavisolibacter sp.]|nr:chitobiase/beta-hexosaminidase C-terminal domain-containing protein [Flavisolibacter sp.]
MQLAKKIGEGFLLAGVCFLLFVLFFEARIHLPAGAQVVGRMHPMLLHFPIVLLLLYFLALWMPLKESDTWVDAVGLLAALSAIVTAITGFLLSFNEDEKGSTFFWHKWGGISIAILAFLLYHLHPYLKRRKILARPLTVLISLVVIMTGHWGAGLTHGEDYLLEPISGTAEREAVPLEQAVAFQHVIQPLLKAKCMGCHGTSSTKGGLAMNDTASLLEGGKTGPLFIAGHPESSLLIKRILLPLDNKKHMVPKTKPQLTEEEIRLLAAWIKSGAPLQQKIIDLPVKDSFRILAASMLSPSSSNNEGQMFYNFTSAGESKIKALNNNYRLVTPLGESSPALSVQFYGKNGYSTKALEELLQVKEQITELSLAKLPVRDGDLKIIAQLQNLRKLNLNYTDVTDEGLIELIALKQLQKLSLAGTAVSSTVAAQLLKLPELATVYIWNTKLNSTDLAALQKQYPNVKLETGYKDDGLTILPLNPPLAKTAPGVYDSSVQIELKHSYKGAEIRYTLDGTEPDSVNSAVYKEPLKMEQFTVVKAKAFKPGWYGSKPLKAV